MVSGHHQINGGGNADLHHHRIGAVAEMNHVGGGGVFLCSSLAR